MGIYERLILPRIIHLACGSSPITKQRLKIVPLASAQRLAARIEGSRLVVAEGAGHVPTVTRPRWVAEQIEAFFG